MGGWDQESIVASHMLAVALWTLAKEAKSFTHSQPPQGHVLFGGCLSCVREKQRSDKARFSLLSAGLLHVSIACACMFMWEILEMCGSFRSIYRFLFFFSWSFLKEVYIIRIYNGLVIATFWKYISCWPSNFVILYYLRPLELIPGNCPGLQNVSIQIFSVLKISCF